MKQPFKLNNAGYLWSQKLCDNFGNRTWEILKYGRDPYTHIVSDPAGSFLIKIKDEYGGKLAPQDWVQEKYEELRGRKLGKGNLPALNE